VLAISAYLRAAPRVAQPGLRNVEALAGAGLPWVAGADWVVDIFACELPSPLVDDASAVLPLPVDFGFRFNVW